MAELPPPPAGDPRRSTSTELEDHLREQVAVLTDAGLATDEAFLVAVKRMGDLDDALAGVRARALGRLWKQLVVAPVGAGREAGGRVDRRGRRLRSRRGRGGARQGAGALRARPRRRRRVLRPQREPLRLPLLTGYFAWKRRLDRRTVWWLAAAFAAAAVFANVYPFAPDGSTEVAHGAAPADRALAGRGRSRTPAAAGARSPAAWTSSASRASCSSTTC